MLAVDGVLTAVASSFFLQLRIGAVPFPITVVISGAINAALVWVALQWTSSPRLAALPMWAWLATVLGLTLGGPGGDLVFDGVGVMGYAVFALIIGGVLPPALVLRWS